MFIKAHLVIMISASRHARDKDMRINIKKIDVKYDPINHRLFIENIEVKPRIRRLKELEEVIYDKEYFEQSDKEMPLYYMYRDLKKKRTSIYLKRTQFASTSQ